MFCPYRGKEDDRPKLEGYVSALARLDCKYCGASAVIENQKVGVELRREKKRSQRLRPN